ncbi:hypothetical protein [Clavibacter sp.]|uniref:hypothetical protein n=1 Tax=Clavibacter sp. TaxID=1871044 RepID=UPI0019B83F47|nr:hypothetical protein [Clavibacter sp.]MBD5381984.1 ribose-phosphate pyrophosphokinase [Clavibacter sp.]
MITFPDGEVHLELTKPIKDGMVDVKCRITNANDLFILMQLSDILKRQEVRILTLTIYYLMGMRCDRVFEINRPFTLKIVADVINSLDIVKKVVVIEPHSSRSHNMIKCSFPISMTKRIADELFSADNKFLFVAPDKGAFERYGESIPCAVICSKVRDAATGKLLDFKAEAAILVKDCDLLVIDDLCDGGGTFVGLAPKLRELEPKSLSLAVTHAVQLDGIKRVAEVYDKVYITNTYKEWQNEELPSNVKVLNVNEFIF